MKINKIITTEKQEIDVDEYTNWYIEICSLFDSLFFMPTWLCGKMTIEIIDKLEIVIKLHYHFWRILRLSTKVVKYMI